MTQAFSKTQIDRLGERLKGERYSDDDLRLLSLYCDSFAEAYQQVVNAIQNQLSLEPSGRTAKSRLSIIAKLKRESIRLTQIQDIAGCRIVVPDINLQNQITQSLVSVFDKTTVVDRRYKPNHGYRAVHVIANVQGKFIEIQVRTLLQHYWAEISERVFDFDPEIKYGGGSKYGQRLLSLLSLAIQTAESLESDFPDTEDETEENEIAALVAKLKIAIVKEFRDLISKLDKRKEYVVLN